MRIRPDSPPVAGRELAVFGGKGGAVEEGDCLFGIGSVGGRSRRGYGTPVFQGQRKEIDRHQANQSDHDGDFKGLSGGVSPLPPAAIYQTKGLFLCSWF